MIVVGLTGGIATGKSTVAAILSDLGATVIDADNVAHSVYRKGLPAWQAIVECFGKTILLPDNEIDRQRLGQIVFQDPRKKEQLNAIVHPYVTSEIQQRLQKLANEDPNRLVVLDVPLLFESGMHEGLAEVIVVYAPETIQLKRLMLRDGLNRADALARIRSQLSIEEKKKLATCVIDNSGFESRTRRQTEQAFDEIKSTYGIR